MGRTAPAVIASLLAAAPAVAGEVCPPVAREQAKVAAAVDGDTLRLQDGRIVRLVSALAPKSGPAGTGEAAPELAESATAALAALTVGKEVGLAVSGQDRYGRLLAYVVVAGAPPRWVDSDMIDKGLAQVYSLVDNYRCAGPLLQREAAARDAEIGLWARDSGAVARADRPEALLRQAGRFALVEGLVRSVGERPRRTYLNFGTNWSQDFTVYVDQGDTARFAAAGVDLKGLEGRRVRVRGWILEDRGPAIHMTHPEQIELVDALGD